MKITRRQLRKLVREQTDNPYAYNRLRKAEQDLHAWERKQQEKKQQRTAPDLNDGDDADHLYNSGFEDAINERGLEHPYSAAYVEGYNDGQVETW